MRPLFFRRVVPGHVPLDWPTRPLVAIVHDVINRDDIQRTLIVVRIRTFNYDHFFTGRGRWRTTRSRPSPQRRPKRQSADDVEKSDRRRETDDRVAAKTRRAVESSRETADGRPMTVHNVIWRKPVRVPYSCTPKPFMCSCEQNRRRSKSRRASDKRPPPNLLFYIYIYIFVYVQYTRKLLRTNYFSTGVFRYKSKYLSSNLVT